VVLGGLRCIVGWQWLRLGQLLMDFCYKINYLGQMASLGIGVAFWYSMIVMGRIYEFMYRLLRKTCEMVI
jgi:hypothetical protein